jgi:hypothetical protein
MLLIIAAALFLPPVFFPATAKAQAPAPTIERFDLDPPDRLVPGEALIFRITGSSRASASVSIEGVNRKIALREVIPGIYEGAYTIRSGDQISIHSAVSGNLRRGNQELSAALAQPLVETTSVATTR